MLPDPHTLLPHRFPLLLVDRITAVEPGKRATGIKTVTGNEWTSIGSSRDAGAQEMPHLLIVEALAQLSAAVLVTLIELLHFGIRRPAEITSRLGITVFATLPYMKSPGEIRWRRLRMVFFFFGILGGIAAALWAVNTYYMPLDLLMDQIVKRFSLLAAPVSPVV